MTPEDNYLPPDNRQEQPAVGIAHRTSPTNIGLAALSALAAYDLGAASRKEAVDAVGNLLVTVKRLPKWRGHLLNWYDTRSLKVLGPGYVSTVDSGNLAACLIALRQGLLEMDEDQLANLCTELLDSMDFSLLFDAGRKLFYIGWDLGKGAPTEGWYDLMASEARLTSYVALARGDVPRKHWARLSRAMLEFGGRCGMASWTGTMFEYLMPELLLPVYRNSLMDGSARFCLAIQKKCSGLRPWGVSESAYFAFDPGMNYRYRANGIRRLALKRGMETETVVSPYSSFLALPLDPSGAVSNLRRLAKLGAEGRYGFFEAVDFDPDRTGSRPFRVVLTYMAHHLGMSLLAIDNALCDGVMQRRFMADRSMAAYRPLLQEKAPINAPVLTKPKREVPEKPESRESTGWSRAQNGTDVLHPVCTVLSNGTYSVLLTETGASRSRFGVLEMTRFEPVQASDSCGMSFWLRSGEEVLPLTPAPDFDQTADYSSDLGSGRGVYYARRDGLAAKMSVMVPDDDAGELRIVSLESNAVRECELVCCFTPVLAAHRDYEAHPLFSALSLETISEGRAVLIHRRSGLFNVSICFLCSRDTVMDTSRFRVLGRSALMCPDAEAIAATGNGAAPDAFVCASVKLTLRPGKREEVRFALAPAPDGRDAQEAASRILSYAPEGNPSRMDMLAAVLGMDRRETGEAMELVADLFFPRPGGREVQCIPRGRDALWRLGISGDLPVAAAELGELAVEDAKRIVRRYAMAAGLGVDFDLVLLLPDGGDYRQPVRSAVTDDLKRLGLEGVLGALGGVHFANRNEPSSEDVKALASAVLGDDEQRERNTSVRPVTRAASSRTGTPVWSFANNGAFTFDTTDGLPPVAWSHILTNGTFGWLASDAGTGHMWYNNSRENRVNSWLNDPLASSGAETLELEIRGERVSLFANGDGRPTRVTYGFGYALWKKDFPWGGVRIAACVPEDADARVFLITIAGMPEDARIRWCTDLVLGSNPADSRNIVTGFRDGVLTAYNPLNPGFGVGFRAASSAKPLSYTGDLLGWQTNTGMGRTGTGMLPCAALVLPAESRMVLAVGCCDEETLRGLTDPVKAAAAFADAAKQWADRVNGLRIRTPDPALDRYVNGWAMYQALACRLMARTSLYQNGGAYGFRDQLQDACNLLPYRPETAREQILRAAAVQFPEGDVLHWWHPAETGTSLKGIRTRCSDDLLWLPYALCEYCRETGDLHFAEAQAGYLTAPELSEGERERYCRPDIAAWTGDLLQHAMRSADLVLKRGTGEHGLCLMGTGDWNDGMNAVGSEGRGESEWLTWFAALTLQKLGSLCRTLGREQDAARYENGAVSLRGAAEACFTGAWFIRGYYDDGTVLGGGSGECAIDSVAQSFAVFAGADPEKADRALDAASERLFDREAGVIRLLTPPFSVGQRRPGYIRDYCPGFRENGGQYTHGAVWLALAAIRAGRTDEGYDMLHALLPSEKDIRIYRGEPYVLAADVVADPACIGRAGWTWYTGSAGWYLRAAEELLGLRFENGRLFVEPRLPAGWDGYEADVTCGQRVLRIAVSGRQVTVNGAPYEDSGYLFSLERSQ